MHGYVVLVSGFTTLVYVFLRTSWMLFTATANGQRKFYPKFHSCSLRRYHDHDTYIIFISVVNACFLPLDSDR